MKNFCAIISEFNPFHNGHEYIVQRAKELSGCDGVIILMSGSFTQRADICIADKYTRARHAILGGADCVLELPVTFSVAPAEIFARGAIKILSAIPSIKTVAFGCECGAEADFINCAKILLSEDEDFKNSLSESLKTGESYIKSLSAALKMAGGDNGILQSSNNILGVEYTKSILKSGKNIKILPIKRVGSGFNDSELKENFSSASAIRENLKDEKVRKNIPEYALCDFDGFFNDCKLYEKLLKISLSRESTDNLKRIYGCTEGIENRLKALEDLPFEQIISGCCNKRYTASRIRRILLASYLCLYRDDCEDFLESPLYLKPLAVKNERSEEIFAALSASEYPLITCGSDAQKLGNVALKCKNLDDFASSQWQQITDKHYKEKLIKV